MTTDEILRAVIIGEGALPIVCADVWLARGHELVALVSPDPRVRQWGSANGIAHAADLCGLAEIVASAPFDYLLSIANFEKLPDVVVNAARRGAINYHDAPLPRYAGSHAPTWALLNGETRHAVTWHVLTGRIDAGDVLVQVPVAIDPDDTALTLNAKCFEAAIDGFGALLDGIEADCLDVQRLVGLPQDMALRTFYRRSQRPDAGCSLRFDAPAGQLDALRRGLDFGPYPNPLGLPKLPLGKSFAIVTGLEVLGSRSADVAGTVVAITTSHLVVSTASHDVALAGLLSMDGAAMTITEAVERGGLRVGAVVAPLAPARAARVTAWCAELAGHEAFWMAQLDQASPACLACASRSMRPTRPMQQTAGRCTAIDIDVGALLIPTGDSAVGHLLAALMVSIARLPVTVADTGTGTRSIDIGFSDPQLRLEVDDLHAFIATCLPLRVRIDPDADFPRVVETVQAQWRQVREHRSYVRDAPVRDPALRGRLESVDPARWPIGVEVLDRMDGVPAGRLAPGRVLTVRLANDGRSCQWLYDAGVLDASDLVLMSRQFTDLLGGLRGSAGPAIGGLRRLA